MSNHVKQIPMIFDLHIIKEVHWRATEATNDGVWMKTFSEPIQRVFYSFAELAKLRMTSTYRVVKNYFNPKGSQSANLGAATFLASLAQSELDKLNANTEMVEWLLERIDAGEMTLSDASMKAQLPALRDHMYAYVKHGTAAHHRRGRVVYDIPSLKVLRNMIKAYRESGRDLMALLPKMATSPSKKRMDVETYRIMRTTVAKHYLSGQRPDGSTVIDDVAIAIDDANTARIALNLEEIPYPSDRSIYREIEALDPFEIVAHRHGLKAAKQKFGIVNGGLVVRRPLERVEIDEWQIDVRNLAIDSGFAQHLTAKQLRQLEKTRRWAVVAIDCATRCIVGFVLTKSPCREATLRVFEQITLDKTNIAEAYNCEKPWTFSGRPELIVMDNGTGFVPQRIRTTAAVLSASVMYTPAGEPSCRGRIERFFGTLASKLMPLLPGRTFYNPQERGDYPTEETICLTDDELTGIMVRWIVDVYHRVGHSGMNGETPEDAWHRLQAQYPVIDDITGFERRVAFGRPFLRKVTGRGLTLFGIEYASELTGHIHLHSKSDVLECRVDERDRSWILIFWEGEWKPVRAKLDYLQGVHLADWLRAMKEVRDANRGKATAKAKDVRQALKAIQETVEAAKTRCNVGPDALDSRTVMRAELEFTRSLRIERQDAQAVAAEPSDVSLDLLCDGDEPSPGVNGVAGLTPRPDTATYIDTDTDTAEDDDDTEISK